LPVPLARLHTHTHTHTHTPAGDCACPKCSMRRQEHASGLRRVCVCEGAFLGHRETGPHWQLSACCDALPQASASAPDALRDTSASALPPRTRVLSWVSEGAGQIACLRLSACRHPLPEHHPRLHLMHLALHLLRLRVLSLADEAGGQIARGYQRAGLPPCPLMLSCEHVPGLVRPCIKSPPLSL